MRISSFLFSLLFLFACGVHSANGQGAKPAPLAGGLTSKGGFTATAGEALLAMGDFLFVERPGNGIVMSLPEKEIPQFATLLMPLNKATERSEVFLDFRRRKATGKSPAVVSCTGEVPEVVFFEKKVTTDAEAIVLQLVYELEKEDDVLRYSLRLPLAAQTKDVKSVYAKRIAPARRHLFAVRTPDGTTTLYALTADIPFQKRVADGHCILLWELRGEGTLKAEIRRQPAEAAAPRPSRASDCDIAH